MKKIVSLAAIASFTLFGCASGPTVTQEQANNAITQADAACAKVKAVNYEWRDSCMGAKDKKTKKHTGILAKAKDAFAKQDYDTAYKLASTSLKHGETAYQQYLDNKDAGPR